MRRLLLRSGCAVPIFSRNFHPQQHSTPVLVLPFLKDKELLMKVFHRDHSLPFNTLRDVLGFKYTDPDTVELVRHSWLDFVTMNEDVGALQEGLHDCGDEDKFWSTSIRIANSSPMVMKALVEIWGDDVRRAELPVPNDLLETLIASLMYHENFEMSSKLVSRCLNNEKAINWKPMVDVAISFHNPTPLEFLAKIWSSNTSPDIYLQVMPHLRSLGLKEPYLNRWNNSLVGIGAFPRDSSMPLNVELKSQLDTANLRSFQNCLKNLAKYEKDPHWLKNPTSLLFLRYILESKDQLDALKTALDSCHVDSFNMSFWKTLYIYSSIPFDELDQRLRQTKFSPENTTIVTAKLRRTSKEKPAEFWTMLASESRADVIGKSYLPILVATIQCSTLEKAMDLALHVLSLDSVNNKFEICKAFIVESTKVIKDDPKRIEQSMVLDQFEEFLKENMLMNDELENYFIFSDLSLKHYDSAVERLEMMIESKRTIDVRTLDHLLKVLSWMRKTHKREDIIENMFRATVSALEQCKEIPSKTWNGILMEVGEHYDMAMIRTFLLRTTELVSAQCHLNIHPSNPNHPLRQVFNDKLTYSILDWGFIKEPENPWAGLDLIRELETKGIYFQENLIKKHLLKLTRILHRIPTVEHDGRIPQRLFDAMKGRIVSGDVETTINALNEMSKRN